MKHLLGHSRLKLPRYWISLFPEKETRPARTHVRSTSAFTEEEEGADDVRRRVRVLTREREREREGGIVNTVKSYERAFSLFSDGSRLLSKLVEFSPEFSNGKYRAGGTCNSNNPHNAFSINKIAHVY